MSTHATGRVFHLERLERGFTAIHGPVPRCPSVFAANRWKCYETRLKPYPCIASSFYERNTAADLFDVSRVTIHSYDHQATGITVDVKDAVISYNAFPESSRTDPYFFYFGSQARVDLRLNYWGSWAAPTFPLNTQPRNLVFPWCLTEDCSSLSRDCSLACGVANCDFRAGKCGLSIGATLLPALLVPISIIRTL